MAGCAILYLNAKDDRERCTNHQPHVHRIVRGRRRLGCEHAAAPAVGDRPLLHLMRAGFPFALLLQLVRPPNGL